MNHSIIVSIDYGAVRCGIAISDPLHMISSPYETVQTPHLMDAIAQIEKDHYPIQTLLLGQPRQMNAAFSEIEGDILKLIQKIKHKFPKLHIERWDERFTSKMAQKIVLNSGIPKNKRKDKGLLDKISASIILQEYLDSKS